MPQTAEEKRAYDRARYAANKEKIKERARANYLANKEKRNAQMKAWREANPERAKRNDLISRWRERGVVCDDFDALYDQYLAATHCADCGVEFAGEYGDGSGAYRCLDHCHETGAFRDVVCPGCNQRRH
jgi:hypothetical protein